MLTDKQFTEAMDSLHQWEQERIEHNAKVMEKIISEVGNKALEGYKQLLDGVDISDKIEIVDKPVGDKQNEDCGVFTEVWVNQWSVGTEGDSFEGFIYGRFAKEKWLKIPYTC